ncbi:MAG: hypothetical protein II381_09355, partial [Victivallales bacterium]|nr:hypothetical protein [Victivallales bacterium]
MENALDEIVPPSALFRSSENEIATVFKSFNAWMESVIGSVSPGHAVAFSTTFAGYSRLGFTFGNTCFIQWARN